MAHNWRDVGRALRLRPGLLNRIGANHSDMRSCLEAVLDRWLRGDCDLYHFRRPSWEQLVEAVAHPVGCDDPFLAAQIAAKHSGECTYRCKTYLYVCCSHTYFFTTDQQPTVSHPATTAQPSAVTRPTAHVLGTWIRH